MSRPDYNLHLRGGVGGYAFDAEFVDFRLNKLKGKPVNVLIDSRGGDVFTAMSILDSFRRHGDVTVHYVGYNASAATIVSMGAKHVSIDKTGMYLVHKASTFVWEFASMNEDEIAQRIQELEAVQRNLVKIDHSIASLYASKCKKSKEDLLALMKTGGWLTPEEALEWGFVDEITDFSEDKQELTDEIVNYFNSEGFPLPASMHSSSLPVLRKLMDKISQAVSSIVSDSKSNLSNMKFKVTNICDWLGVNEISDALSKDQTEKVEAKIVELKNDISEKENTINSLNEKVTNLENEIKDLKDKAAGKIKDIVDPQPKDKKDEDETVENSEIAEYFDSVKKAHELFNSLR